MKTEAELLFIHGFLKESAGEIAKQTSDERRELLADASDEEKQNYLSHVHEERIETSDGHFSTTGYPESLSNHRLIYESPSNSIEDNYFWVLEHLRQDRGFHTVHKILDMYAASEASAFWGNQQQRISAQQNQASQLLANVGKFVRDLFQMVRELRILDERLEAYNNWKESPSADVTLKSIFTDVVEGGTKNPQSVFGLAQTVGFTILPDLFFNTKVYSTKELDRIIKDMEYNESVKQVLRRKLYQFINWKEKTHKELENRRIFNIRYLRQHWAIIKMYMGWVKPYVRNLKHLSMRGDLEENPDMISSFDTNMSEVEILAKKGTGPIYGVVIVNFKFRTRPDMSVRREYQQGPAHMGRLDMTFRSYAWTDDQIEAYKAFKSDEDFNVLGYLDPSLEEIMEGLGDDFHKYITEHEGTIPDKEQKKDKKKEKKKVSNDFKNAVEPFTAIFGGFGELFGFLIPRFNKTSPKKKGDFGKVAGSVKVDAFLTWHIYKKAKRMLTW